MTGISILFFAMSAGISIYLPGIRAICIFWINDLAMFICNLAPHRKHLTPVNPVPTQDDPANENKWFNRKLIGEDDLIGEIDDIDTL